MADYFVLSEDDRNLLKAFLDQQRNNPLNPRYENINVPPQMSPEVYLALNPEGNAAIPACSASDDPGSAVCQICFMDPANSYIITPLEHPDTTAVTRTVFNPYRMPVFGEPFILITRDKFGRWMAERPGMKIVQLDEQLEPEVDTPGGAQGTYMTGEPPKSASSITLTVRGSLLNTGDPILSGSIITVELIDGYPEFVNLVCPPIV